MNPFDWTGPEFLTLYAVLFFVGLGLALVLRFNLRTPREALIEEPVLRPYELAYLASGATGAVNAALVQLIHKNHLMFDEASGDLYVKGALPDDADPLEKALVTTTEVNYKVQGARKAAADQIGRIRNRLIGLGLELSDAQDFHVRWWPVAVMLAVGLFGLLKVVVGASRNKPVGILVVAVVITGAAAFFFAVARPRRTQRGDSFLARLKSRYAALKEASVRSPASLAGHDLALAVGLFGVTVLAAGPLANFAHALTPPAGGGGGDTGSGCGGGDDGGSGCGGGGGCGGCGGGGGD